MLNTARLLQSLVYLIITACYTHVAFAAITNILATHVISPMVRCMVYALIYNQQQQQQQPIFML